VTYLAHKKGLNILYNDNPRIQLVNRFGNDSDQQIPSIAATCVGVAAQPPAAVGRTHPLAWRACSEKCWSSIPYALPIALVDLGQGLAEVTGYAYGARMVAQCDLKTPLI
jgi:hypothetical protein